MRKFLTTLVLWLVYVPAAHAQNLGKGILDDVAGEAKINTETNFAMIIGNLVRVFIGLLGIVFLLLTIYAGYLYLTARGEEEKVKHAKETLQRGVIGLLIIGSAYAIASFVLNALTGATSATAQ